MADSDLARLYSVAISIKPKTLLYESEGYKGMLRWYRIHISERLISHLPAGNAQDPRAFAHRSGAKMAFGGSDGEEWHRDGEDL